MNKTLLAFGICFLLGACASQTKDYVKKSQELSDVFSSALVQCAPASQTKKYDCIYDNFVPTAEKIDQKQAEPLKQHLKRMKEASEMLAKGKITAKQFRDLEVTLTDSLIAQRTAEIQQYQQEDYEQQRRARAFAEAMGQGLQNMGSSYTAAAQRPVATQPWVTCHKYMDTTTCY